MQNKFKARNAMAKQGLSAWIITSSITGRILGKGFTRRLPSGNVELNLWVWSKPNGDNLNEDGDYYAESSASLCYNHRVWYSALGQLGFDVPDLHSSKVFEAMGKLGYSFEEL